MTNTNIMPKSEKELGRTTRLSDLKVFKTPSGWAHNTFINKPQADPRFKTREEARVSLRAYKEEMLSKGITNSVKYGEFVNVAPTSTVVDPSNNIDESFSA